MVRRAICIARWAASTLSAGLASRIPALTARLTTEVIVFRHDFAVPGWREPAPAGTYTVETAEALIEGLSFPAYRRLSTTITRQSRRAGGVVQAIAIEPQALQAALAFDVATDLPRGG